MKFFRTENAAAYVLLAASIAGFVLANSGLVGVLNLAFDFSLGGGAVSPRSIIVTVGLSAFFFLVGTELKRELSHGMFSDRRRLLPPLAAAVLGVAVPAAVFALINLGGSGFAGWAIPTATDLTFSLAVFNIFGGWLGARARLFLLAFAVIDDVVAVVLVTVLFSAKPNPWYLITGLLCAGFFALCNMLPGYLGRWLSVAAWLGAVILTQASGVEAALMAVLLGFLVPAAKTVKLEQTIHPLVAFIALPLFAFQATAVSMGTMVIGAVFIGVAVRPLTKFIGIFAGGFLGSLFITRAERLTAGVIARLASLGGIGFTVSLLVADLAFKNQPALQHEAVAGTFVAAGVTMVLGGVALVAGHRPETADRP
ncbi:MAG: Na+/H+ antiporter NhaA [Micrococcales bacterium]